MNILSIIVKNTPFAFRAQRHLDWIPEGLFLPKLPGHFITCTLPDISPGKLGLCCELGQVASWPVYTVHCRLYTIHCTVYSIHCTLYTVHYTLYTLYLWSANVSCAMRFRREATSLVVTKNMPKITNIFNHGMIKFTRNKIIQGYN